MAIGHQWYQPTAPGRARGAEHTHCTKTHNEQTLFDVHVNVQIYWFTFWMSIRSLAANFALFLYCALTVVLTGLCISSKDTHILYNLCKIHVSDECTVQSLSGSSFLLTWPKWFQFRIPRCYYQGIQLVLWDLNLERILMLPTGRAGVKAPLNHRARTIPDITSRVQL